MYILEILRLLFNIANTHAVGASGASGAPVITEHPENVTARVGESVLIRCEYDGTSVLPKWIINDEEFAPTQLPPQYVTTSKGLQIP